MANLAHVHFIGSEPAIAMKHRSRKSEELHASLKKEPNPTRTADTDPVISVLLREAGLDPRIYKCAPMQRRMPSCLRAMGVRSMDEAVEFVKCGPKQAKAGLNALLIGVTSFFREKGVFDFLQNHAIPELLRRRNGLRVYSAGVSDGHELYSVAMLLEAAGVLEQSYLLGVDCRGDAIGRAQAGRFDLKDVVGLDPGIRERHFRLGTSYAAISPRMRSALHWQVADLISFDPGANFDLILFRNVAIYLSDNAEPVWARLVSSVRNGGFLVTGKAEQPPAHLPLARMAASIYKKVEK